MSISLILLVLLAALLHATWNALIKIGEDRMVAMALLSGSAGLFGVVLAFFAPLPAPASWPYIAATSVIHVGYFWFLGRAYEVGDFAEVYPIARGSAPLLTLTASALLLGEVPEGSDLFGILLIGLGIMSLALSGTRTSHRPLLFALATGAFIASYTVTDGVGVRLSGTVLGYTAWLFALHGIPFIVMVGVLRRGKISSAISRNWKAGVFGGGLSFLAYGIVLFAFSLGAIAPVAALRETSVVFAALIAAVFFKEGFGWRRIFSAGVVAAGILLLSL